MLSLALGQVKAGSEQRSCHPEASDLRVTYEPVEHKIREYQAFPKLLGVAERAWNRNTPSPQQMPAAWDVFVNTLGQVTLPLLSFYHPVGLPGVGVNYRIPLPGGQIEGGVLNANVRNPGLAIEYSVDKGMNWVSYQGPVNVGASAWLRTRAPDGRTSRISYAGQP